MWLYVEKPVAPQRTVASKYGDLRIWVPKPKSAVSAWCGRGVPELVMGRRLRLDGKGDAAGHAPAGDHRTVLPGATDDDHLDVGGGLGHRDEVVVAQTLHPGRPGSESECPLQFTDPHPGLVEEIGGHIVAGPAVGGAGRSVLGAQGDEVLALADRRCSGQWRSSPSATLSRMRAGSSDSMSWTLWGASPQWIVMADGASTPTLRA